MDDSDRTCTASQLIAALQGMVAEHGDLPVFARDADTEGRMPIGLIWREADRSLDLDRFEIRTSYYGRPRGDLAPGGATP